MEVQNLIDHDVLQERDLSAPLTPPPSPTPTPPRGLGQRHLFALLGFLGFANVYAMRVNLSVAIVAMVNNTAIEPRNSSMNGTGDECVAPIHPTVFKYLTPEPSTDGPFDWDAETQGLILGSFFYGYVITQIPGGRMAEVYGGKWVFGIGVLVTSIFTLIMPFVAKINTYLLIAVRIMEGLGEGVTFPVMHAMLAKWCAPLERSKLSAFIYAGSQFGTIISLPLSGLLCDYWGWESVFYLFGALGFVWFFFWCAFVYDSPEKHPRIGHQGGEFLMEVTNVSHTPLPIPWSKIFTSGPMWAIILAHMTQNWGFYVFLTEMPTYLKNILHFNMNENAFLSALPYIFTFMIALSTSYTADWIREKRLLSTTVTRKLFLTVGFFCPGVCCLGLAFTGCNSTVVMVLLCLVGGLNGANSAAQSVNHLDIAPNFAGTLMGISNMAANMMGFLAPGVVGHIVQVNGETHSAWRLVFIITSVVYIAGWMYFVAFGSGKEQPWNKPECHEGPEVTSAEEDEEEPRVTEGNIA